MSKVVWLDVPTGKFTIAHLDEALMRAASILRSSLRESNPSFQIENFWPFEALQWVRQRTGTITAKVISMAYSGTAKQGLLSRKGASTVRNQKITTETLPPKGQHFLGVLYKCLPPPRTLFACCSTPSAPSGQHDQSTRCVFSGLAQDPPGCGGRLKRGRTARRFAR